MPQKLSKSWAILGRRKSGKTAFVQRVFNELWSANGQVIPFYFSVPDMPIAQRTLAFKYCRTFVSHYISFLKRDPQWVRQLLTMEEIRAYGEANGLSVLVNGEFQYKNTGKQMRIKGARILQNKSALP